MNFRIIIIASLLLALSGCVSTSKTDFTMTDTEKQAVKDGSLVKPDLLTTIDRNTINVSKSGKTLICITLNSLPKDYCYQHLSERAAEYYEKAGIHTTTNRQEAASIIELTLGFGYTPTVSGSVNARKSGAV